MSSIYQNSELVQGPRYLHMDVYDMVCYANHAASKQLRRQDNAAATSFFAIPLTAAPVVYENRSVNVNIGNSHLSHNVDNGEERKDNHLVYLIFGVIGLLGSLFALGTNVSSYQYASRKIREIQGFESILANKEESRAKVGTGANDSKSVAAVLRATKEMFGLIKSSELFGLISKVGIFASSAFVIIGSIWGSSNLLAVAGFTALISLGAILFKSGSEWTHDPIKAAANRVLDCIQTLRDSCHRRDTRFEHWNREHPWKFSKKETALPLLTV